MGNPEPTQRHGRLFAALLATTLLATTMVATTIVASSVPAFAKPSAPASRYASIVMEAETGNVLYERNADLPRYPASLTKIMTLYLTFEALASKKLALTDQLTFSEHAVTRDPSRLDLPPGAKLKVEDAIRAITTKSANDAACALAEALAKGSESRFAEMMTAKGKALGLQHTTFLNASGLPEEGHLTTARDLAILSRALIHDYPDYYRYVSTNTFDWKGMRYPNQNRFLHTYYGADGIKTGFVNASGHNLAASAVRGDKRLIAIVLGGDTQGWTREHASRLLDVSYAKIDPSLVMVASNATGTPASPTDTKGPAPAPAPAAETYSTPAGAVTIASAVALPQPNATANLAAFAAASSPSAGPVGSVGPLPTVAMAPAEQIVPYPIPRAAVTAEAPRVAAATEAPTRAAATTDAPPRAGATNEAPTRAAAHANVVAETANPTAAAEAVHASVVDKNGAQMLASSEPAPVPPPPGPPPTPGVHAAASPSTEPASRTAPASVTRSTAASPATTSPVAEKSPTTSSANLAREPDPRLSPAGDWSVQVGLFRDATSARRRGEEARKQMPLPLRGADLIVSRAQDGVHVMSRIGRLSEQDAREACSQLQRGRMPCVVVPPGRPLVVATN